MKLVARPSFVGDEPTTDIIDKDNGNLTVASDVAEHYLELFVRVSPEKVKLVNKLFLCPSCDWELCDMLKFNFCDNCGQKLDWEGIK